MQTFRRSTPMSRMEQLPAELLEKILLEAVMGVRPPVTETESFGIRCYEEMNRGQSLAAELLLLRYVCRTFRDCSWPALGTVIGETAFDLCSKKSIGNLVAISKCAKLAPWIRKLTVSSNFVNGPWPKALRSSNFEDVQLEEALGTGLLNDLRSTLDDDRSWYPELWKSITRSHFGSVQSSQRSIASSQLCQLLAHCLKSLPNVANLHYFYGHCAGRFMPFAYETWSGCEYDVLWHTDAHPGTQIGQNIFLKTLADSPIHLSKLELATEMDGPHCFRIQATTEVVKKVFKEVEILTLRDDFGDHGFWDTPNMALSSIVITKSNFPVLHTLVLDGWMDHSLESNQLLGSSLPSAMDVPSLNSLVIIQTAPDDSRLVSFITLLKDTLRSATFSNMSNENYKPMFESFQNFNLERLTIIHACLGKYGIDLLTVENVSQKLFYGAAKTVVVEPATSMNALVEKWARKNDGGDLRSSD